MREKKYLYMFKRLEFKMEKENFFDDESDSEDEEKVMAAFPDSDIDEMKNELINMNPNI